MTSADLKDKLNSLKQELIDNNPDDSLNNSFSNLNPSTVDINITEISFEDSDEICETGEVFYPDDYEDDDELSDDHPKLFF